MIPKEPELAAMGIFEETIDVVPEEHEENMWEPIVQTSVSMTFMFLVGLSIPAMFGINAEDNSGGLGLGTILCHVIAVSGLMTLGKMFCLICYRDEVNWRQRLALSLGMCPRGEVGASIIVIALELGMEGPTIIVALCALGGNLVMSGAFIALVKYLVNYDEDSGAEDEYVIQTAFDGETFNETPSTASPDTINDNVKDLDDVDDDCIIGKIGDTVVDAVVVQEVNSNDDPDKDTAANPGVVYLS
jgi:Kef-type K+ transport system membrane component KefB